MRQGEKKGQETLNLPGETWGEIVKISVKTNGLIRINVYIFLKKGTMLENPSVDNMQQYI